MEPGLTNLKSYMAIDDDAAADRLFERRALLFLALASAALVLVTVVCGARLIASSAGLNYVSGTWAALAVDASHGTLYRPLIGPLGYGGTRYMPLAFLLHAAFIKLLRDAVVAGHVSTLLSATFLLTGVYRLVKTVGRNRPASVFAVALVLASSAIQIELVSVRGDLLAAALNVWALTYCARAVNNSGGKRNIAFAGALFALAFLTKFTTLFGFTAGIASLAFSGKKRDSFLLTSTAVTFMAAGLLLIYVGSHGRAWDVFRASATGGASVKNILLGPTMWFRVADSDDPWGLATIALCAAVLVTMGTRRWLELIPLNLIVTTLATIFMFGSPGVWANHLMDMNIAAIVFLAVESSRNVKHRALVAGTLGLVTLFATAHIFFRVHSGLDYFSLSQPPVASMKDEWARAERLIHGQGPLLSENPWLPIMSNETPYALDSFSFRLASERDRALAADLSAKLEARYFRAVVLMHDPENQAGHQFIDQWDFGPGFSDRLLRCYGRAYTSRYFILYLPRGNMSTAREATMSYLVRKTKGLY